MSTSTDSPEYLTVPELAELLRVKERKVYDLAASGEVPCSRATGKLLFPAGEVRAWIGAAQSGSQTRRPTVFLGSHDPLLDWALRHSQSGMATFFDSSRDGLSRFAAGEGVATGLHLLDAESGAWNIAAARDVAEGFDAVLIGWAARARGLVIRSEDKGSIRSLEDLVGRRLVPRQSGAGSAQLLVGALSASGADETLIEMIPPALSEQDAVMAVRQGEADAAFGLEAVARPFGLRFVPIMQERFDLLIDRRAWFEPPLQTLFAFAMTREFQEHAARLGGYDLSDLGAVRWNA